MKILGIIPARSGSKGIENKNFYPICGVPMIEYTVGAAANSNLDSFLISTDYELNRFPYDDVTFVHRPKQLATDDAKMIDVVKHIASEYPLYDAYMILQPTSPLRTIGDINGAIGCFNGIKGATSLYSGYLMGVKHKDKIYDKWNDMMHFQRNGAIFIVTKELLEQGKLWDQNVVEYIMPKSRSVDVDDMDDLKMAEALLMYDFMED
jgi:CMP-N-acetylneuraminic acid synthetase